MTVVSIFNHRIRNVAVGFSPPIHCTAIQLGVAGVLVLVALRSKLKVVRQGIDLAIPVEPLF